MAYSAGTAFLQVVPSFQGVVTAISAEASKWGDAAGQAFAKTFNAQVRRATGTANLGPSTADVAKQGDTAGGKFADSFKARVDAALRALPDITVDADAGPAEAKLAELRAELVELSGKTVGVDISDADALAKLAELTAALKAVGAESPNVRVKVDTAAAVGELGAFTLAADAASGAGGGGGGISGLLSGVEGLGSSLSSGAPMWVGLGALATALIPLGGLALGGLSALPAILGGIGTGITAVGLGFSGVFPAIKAFRATLNTVGETAAQVKTKQDALARSMAGLSPAGQGFVAFVAGQLLPIFDQLKTAVQEALLPGVTAGLQAMLPLFKAVQPFIVDAAKGIGDFARALGAFLGSTVGIAETKGILQSASGFMTEMGKAALVLVKAFGSIGLQATPVVRALGNGILSVVQAFDRWAEGGGFQKFLQWLQKNGPGIVDAIVRLGKGIGTMIVALAPVGIVVLNLISYIAEFVGWLTKAWPILVAVATVIGGALAIAVAVLGAPIELLGAAIAALVVAALELAAHWSAVWGAISGAAVAAWHAIDGGLVQPLTTFFTVTVPSAISAAVGWFTGLPAQILGALGALGSLLVQSGEDVINGLVSGFTTAIGAVTSFITAIPGEIVTWIGDVTSTLSGKGSDVINGLVAGFTAAVGAVSSFIAAIPGEIVGWIGDVTSTLVGKGSDVINGLINGIKAAVGGVASLVGAIPFGILQAVGDLGSLLFSAGKAVVQGLINGIKSMGSAAVNAISGIAGDIARAAKSVLSIFSPSRVMFDIGANVGQGLALGISSTGSTVQTAASGLATETWKSVRDALTATVSGVGGASSAIPAFGGTAFPSTGSPVPYGGPALSSIGSLVLQAENHLGHLETHGGSAAAIAAAQSQIAKLQGKAVTINNVVQIDPKSDVAAQVSSAFARNSEQLITALGQLKGVG